jgi:hypothetical protein
MFRRNRSRAHHDLRTITLENIDLLDAHLVGHHEHALVTLACSDNRETDTGIARCRFDDRAAGFQCAGFLSRLDHTNRDAILHRPAGIQLLKLGKQLRAPGRRDAIEPHQRCVADEVEQAVVNVHTIETSLLAEEPDA